MAKKIIKSTLKQMSLLKLEKEEKGPLLTTKKAIDNYINLHKDWWRLALLDNFVQRIKLLVTDKELQRYFALQVGKLRTRLMNENAISAGEASARARNRRLRSDDTCGVQPGDIYGAPMFFRYGEAGKSRKKMNDRRIKSWDEWNKDQ